MTKKKNTESSKPITVSKFDWIGGYLVNKNHGFNWWEGIEDVIKHNPDMVDWDNINDNRPEGATEEDGHYYVDENGERQWIDY